MIKTILITGATDGIGLVTAKLLASEGHSLLIHGRSPEKLDKVKKELTAISNVSEIKTYKADLSVISEVKALAETIKSEHTKLDVLINNAGVFKVSQPITQDGLDLRFVVNTIAPYLLTKALMPLFNSTSRVVNLSSAAQAPVDTQALLGKVRLTDMEAYAQSKLAITMWTQSLAKKLEGTGPLMVAVNPGSLLASKMVKEGFGVAGKDINIGAKILIRMAIREDLKNYSGQYFDNDKGTFSSPHPDGLVESKIEDTINAIEKVLNAGMPKELNNKQLKSKIRQKIRADRNSLSSEYQNQAANQLIELLSQQALFNQAKHIACFLSFDGEISTKPIIQTLFSQNKSCYLPKLRPFKPNRLWFMPYELSSQMSKNRYGIPEVDLPVNKAIAPSQIDLVLLPLVAFDNSGNRLGMGSGYYDATFAHLRKQKKRPISVGLAYSHQLIKDLPSDPWDLPLDAVCTNERFYRF